MSMGPLTRPLLSRWSKFSPSAPTRAHEPVAASAEGDGLDGSGTRRYYLLTFANFLAAVGGGAILSSGTKTLDDTFSEGPIVALFVGTLIGLVIQQLVPPRWRRPAAPWFSVAVGPTSLALAGLFVVCADDEKLQGAAAFFFVALLSVRFALWFFSRALRAQTAGSAKQGIPLIELGYYSGMVFGLVVQKSGDFGMLSALLADALLLPVAGLIDIANADGRKAPEPVPDGPRAAGATPDAADGEGTAVMVAFDYRWYWRLTAAVVCLTVGFQAVAFSVGPTEKWLTPYVFACFYAGVALAALCCKVFKIKFDWTARDGRAVGNATLCSESPTERPTASFGLITLLATASMVAALSARGLGLGGGRVELPFLAASAFIYQIIVLSLLDRIGRAAKAAGLTERIMLTYLILGAATVLSMLLLMLSSYKHSAGVAVTLACALVSFYAVRRRADVHA